MANRYFPRETVLLTPPGLLSSRDGHVLCHLTLFPSETGSSVMYLILEQPEADQWLVNWPKAISSAPTRMMIRG